MEAEQGMLEPSDGTRLETVEPGLNGFDELIDPQVQPLVKLPLELDEPSPAPLKRLPTRRDVPHLVPYPRVSVVIPTLNEAENLPHVLPRIPASVHEVVLIDGHSTDGTCEVAQRVRPDIRIVNQRGTGKGDALRTGFAEATGDVIVTLDADGSADPAEIPAFVGALMAGADFAKGSRFMQGGGSDDITLHRRAGNHGLVLLVRLLFGSRYTDLCYGYNAFWTDVLDRLDVDAPGFEIETALNICALRSGLRVAEVSSFEHPRLHGYSKLNTFGDGFRVLRTIVREARRRRRNHPLLEAQRTA